MDVPPHGPALSEQLSQWIDWTRAVALSRALDGRLVAAEIASEKGGTARIKIGDREEGVTVKPGTSYRWK